MWHYYWLAVRKTFVITGRASPKEWWGFYLAALVLLAIFSSIASLLYFITNQLGITLPFLKILYTHPWITLGIVNYILLIPIVSVTFRRLQDTNASPWPLVCIFFTAIFLFYMKFPFKTPIGVVVWSIIGAGYIYYVFYRLCIPGTIGNNKYGPPPLNSKITNSRNNNKDND